MNLPVAVLFFMIFVYAGVEDYKKREVSGVISALAWLLCGLFGVQTTLLVITFGITWILSIIVSSYYKREVFGWADVILVPIFIAVVTSMLGYTTAAGLLIGAIIVGQISLFWNKKDFLRAIDYIDFDLGNNPNAMPFVSILAAFFIVAFCLFLL